jgi:hypothetical protein
MFLDGFWCDLEKRRRLCRGVPFFAIELRFSRRTSEIMAENNACPEINTLENRSPWVPIDIHGSAYTTIDTHVIITGFI